MDVNGQRAGFATDARDRQLNLTKTAAADNTAPAEHNRRDRRQKPARRNQTMKRKQLHAAESGLRTGSGGAERVGWAFLLQRTGASCSRRTIGPRCVVCDTGQRRCAVIITHNFFLQKKIKLLAGAHEASAVELLFSFV